MQRLPAVMVAGGLQRHGGAGHRRRDINGSACQGAGVTSSISDVTTLTGAASDIDVCGCHGGPDIGA